MKSMLTERDYLTLQGVLTLADSHRQTLNNLEHLITEIIGDTEDEYSMWALDAILERWGADELLRKIGITIAKEPTPNDV